MAWRKKLVRGSNFLETTFQKLIFENNKLIREDGEDMSDPFHKIYLYNDDGSLSEIKRFAKHPYTQQIREYDTNILKQIDDTTLEQTNYIGYDRNYSRELFTLKGSTIEEVRYNKDNKSTDRTEYLYNENMCLMSKSEYIIYREHIPSDDNIASMDIFPHSGEDISNYESPDNDITEFEKEFTDGEEILASKTVYKYDEHNFLVEDVYYREDSKQFRLIYYNDSYGNPTHIINYEGDDVVDFKKFKYKYDRYGNWILRKEYEVEKWNKKDFKIKLHCNML